MARQSLNDYLAERAEIDPEQRGANDLMADYRTQGLTEDQARSRVLRFFPTADLTYSDAEVDG